MGKKSNYYFPPKKQKTPTPITISDDVKAELHRLAKEQLAYLETQSLDRYLVLVMATLHTEPSFRFGAERLNRFAGRLTAISEELANKPGWYPELTRKLEAMGVEAFKGASEGKFDDKEVTP